jgi:3-phosphoshikimate 1-carboxyvinyltransferase
MLKSNDCISTMNCLRAMGVKFEHPSESILLIHGNGKEALQEPGEVLDAGNSGTTMRLISGLLASSPFFSCISGDNSLNKRPMKRVIEPLRQMGAKIWGRGGDSFAPIAFKGSPLQCIDYTMPVASAQVKSALLLAGLFATGTTRIMETQKTRDHSENMLLSMGAPLHVSGNSISIDNLKTGLSPLSVIIPGDFSSASFFIAAALLMKKSNLTLLNIGVNKTRTGFADIVKTMGAEVHYEDCRDILQGEPVATIMVRNGSLKGTDVNGDIIPLAIDELPLLAVLATQAEGVTRVTGAQELRVKESDRITAITSELKKMGASITETPDGFIVEGPVRLKGARCKSHGDHRIAMSMAIAALVAEGDTIIEDAGSVTISFPEFFTLLNSGIIS